MSTTSIHPESPPALQACLARHHSHAASTFRLDEELGTLHGIAWTDFVLLDVLDNAAGALNTAQLATQMGMRPSRLLQLVLPLERIGLLERTPATQGQRQVALRPSGRRLLREARQTAESICALEARA